MAARTLAAKKHRAYQALENDEDSFLKQFAAGTTKVCTDEKNGRWRISCSRLEVGRSISWTKIGPRVAACVAIRQSWEWHLEVGRYEIPLRSCFYCRALLDGLTVGAVRAILVSLESLRTADVHLRFPLKRS